MKPASLLAATSVCGSAVHHLQLSGAFVQEPILRPTRRVGTSAGGRRRRPGRLLPDVNNIDARASRGALLGTDVLVELAENDLRARVPDAAVVVPPPMDRRPHEQRVSSPRKARRLNHPFQHLYRHSDPWWEDDEWDRNETIAISDEVRDFYGDVLQGNSTRDVLSSGQQFNSTFAQQAIDVETSLRAIQYLRLHGGYTLDEIRRMHVKFPPLLEMDVARHLRPKMRFVKDCLGGATAGQVLDPQLKSRLPANFFGARLERTIAPRHAFLVHVGLPSGKLLWETSSSDGRGGITFLIEEFLLMHRKTKQFAAMCNKWRTLYGSSTLKDNLPITSEQIAAFDKLFQRGILSAVRDDSGYIFPDYNGNGKREITDKSPSLLQTANVTSAQLVRYLVEHGANPWETDVRGASLFHWASGCGNLQGLRELVDGCDLLESRIEASGMTSAGPKSMGTHAALLWKASRDDATPFHWAAAGAGPKEFGKFLV